MTLPKPASIRVAGDGLVLLALIAIVLVCAAAAAQVRGPQRAGSAAIDGVILTSVRLARTSDGFVLHLHAAETTGGSATLSFRNLGLVAQPGSFCPGRVGRTGGSSSRSLPGHSRTKIALRFPIAECAEPLQPGPVRLIGRIEARRDAHFRVLDLRKAPIVTPSVELAP